MGEPRCPVCAIDLVAGDPGQRSCGKCKGTWIGRAAFADMMQALGGGASAAIAPVASRAVRACPDCGAAMTTGTVLEVLVDRCADHGVWADAGELSRIVLAARRAAR